MFSGIVETSSEILETRQDGPLLRIFIKKPSNFKDISIGDSIAVDGVCLTLEGFDDQTMAFALGPETLRVTGWSEKSVPKRAVNLERSLRLNDRIHGHLVTGHVDARSTVKAAHRNGDTLDLKIALPPELKPLIWPKGSVAINGVSLTVNAVESSEFTVGLIPETLRRTNLGTLSAGQSVNLEADNSARGLLRFFELQKEMRP